MKFRSKKKIHDNVSNYGDYQCGNVLISLILKKSSLTRTGTALKKSHKRWEYTFPTGTDHVAVCKIFLCNVLGVNKSRIENVQQKVIQNQSLADNRGNNQNHSVRLRDDIKKLIQQHCQSLPHSVSHFPIGESAYEKLFNYQVNFSFSSLRIDVCDNERG